MKTIGLKILMVVEYIAQFILLLLGVTNNLTINDPLLLVDDDITSISPYISISSICINNKVSLSLSCQQGLCITINVDDIEVICNIIKENHIHQNNDDTGNDKKW
jgi:hypothetical protein